MKEVSGIIAMVILIGTMIWAFYYHVIKYPHGKPGKKGTYLH
jgi:hypothetical protein